MSRFDKFIEVFNNERPHEALDMKCPAEVYQDVLEVLLNGLADIPQKVVNALTATPLAGNHAASNAKLVALRDLMDPTSAFRSELAESKHLTSLVDQINEAKANCHERRHVSPSKRPNKP